MADPGDTAALCNDTKSHLPYEPGQPADPDMEAGSVIGEEPTSQGGVEGEELEGEVGDGEEGEEEAVDPAAVAEAEAAARKAAAEAKVPFIYNIVEPGCTALSCYSAIITFIIMSCGVFWLLLISPPLNAKAYETRLPWEDKLNTTSSLALADEEGTLDSDVLLEDLGSGGGAPETAALVGGLEVEETGGGGGGGPGGTSLSASTHPAAAVGGALPANQT